MLRINSIDRFFSAARATTSSDPLLEGLSRQLESLRGQLSDDRSWKEVALWLLNHPIDWDQIIKVILRATITSSFPLKTIEELNPEVDLPLDEHGWTWLTRLLAAIGDELCRSHPNYVGDNRSLLQISPQNYHNLWNGFIITRQQTNIRLSDFNAQRHGRIPYQLIPQAEIELNVLRILSNPASPFESLRNSSPNTASSSNLRRGSHIFINPQQINFRLEEENLTGLSRNPITPLLNANLSRELRKILANYGSIRKEGNCKFQCLAIASALNKALPDTFNATFYLTGSREILKVLILKETQLIAPDGSVDIVVRPNIADFINTLFDNYKMQSFEGYKYLTIDWERPLLAINTEDLSTQDQKFFQDRLQEINDSEDCPLELCYSFSSILAINSKIRRLSLHFKENNTDLYSLKANLAQELKKIPGSIDLRQDKQMALAIQFYLGKAFYQTLKDHLKKHA
jgi:hypothetical protein